MNVEFQKATIKGFQDLGRSVGWDREGVYVTRGDLDYEMSRWLR